MESREVDTSEQKPIKRFVTYEDFLKAFYPESAASIPSEEEGETEDFGTNLAINSLERHAEILKFGDA